MYQQNIHAITISATQWPSKTSIKSFQLSTDEDKIDWISSADVFGCFYIWSFVHWENSEAGLKRFWKYKAESNVQFHLWLLLQNKIWTVDRLMIRGCPHSPMCKMCNLMPESTAHLFLSCAFAREIWQLLSLVTPSIAAAGLIENSVTLWLAKVFATAPVVNKRRPLDWALDKVWNLWKERNRRTFEGKEASANVVFSLIRDKVEAFRAAWCEG